MFPDCFTKLVQNYVLLYIKAKNISHITQKTITVNYLAVKEGSRSFDYHEFASTGYIVYF